MRLKVVLAGMLLATSLCSAWQVQAAQQVSLDWLKVVAFAAHQTEYSGVFVYQYGSRVDTSRIIHVVGQDSEFERLERLDGPRREIIRHHGQVWMVLNDQMFQVDSQHTRQKFPALLTDQLQTVEENYEILPAGTERVAGYTAQVIYFKPKDGLRFSQKIWVHTDTGLLLKASVLNSNEQVVEQYSFTQLQIGGEIDRSWIQNLNANIPVGHGHKNTDMAKATTMVNSGWIAEMIPAGFKKVTEIERPMHGKSFSVTQIVFSDGLSAISVFIEPGETIKMPQHVAGRGAVNMSRRLLDKNLITVVGEVPAQVVKQIANSVRFVGVN